MDKLCSAGNGGRMNFTNKPFEELDIMDDFLINALAPGLRGIRMDVEVEERRNDKGGLQFIYFYTGGSKGGNKDIREMLRYFQESTKENVTNDAIRKIHDYVNKVKILPEVKVEYMKKLWYMQEKKGKSKDNAKGVCKRFMNF